MSRQLIENKILESIPRKKWFDCIYLLDSEKQS